MKNSRAAFCFSASILLTLTSVGCGSGNFTPPPSSVVATSNPLVAKYTINRVTRGTTAWVEFGPDTSYGRQTSVTTASGTTEFGENISILVAGMKPQSIYHLRAHANTPGGLWVDEDHTFTTGALPASMAPPGITVIRPTPNLSPSPGVELLSMTGSQMLASVVTDLQGNIIWYYPQEGAPIKLMQNGHLILNLSQDLREIDLAGNTIRDFSVSGVNQSLQTNGYSFVILNFSHDVLTLPNGHWITIGQISKDFVDLPGYPGVTSVLGDAIVDIDPNGNVVWGWSAFDHLDVNRHLQGLPDWTHSNALVYTPEGNLLISVRHQSWILKIDYAEGTGSGAVLWKLGEDGDFTLSGGDPSQWFYAQHDPNIQTSDGAQMTLSIYDNGNLRIDSQGVACGSTSTAPACFSRATTFQIDESTTSATMLWQYLPSYYSFWGGSIGQLSNGDVEFDSSEPFPATPAASQITEVTSGANPQTVWQMTITGENAYRGDRIPSLYPGVTWQQ